MIQASARNQTMHGQGHAFRIMRGYIGLMRQKGMENPACLYRSRIVARHLEVTGRQQTKKLENKVAARRKHMQEKEKGKSNGAHGVPLSVEERIRRHSETFDPATAYAEIAGSGELDFSLVSELARNEVTLCVERACARVMGSVKAILTALWPITREMSLKSLSTADVEEMDGRILLPISSLSEIEASVGVAMTSGSMRTYLPSEDESVEMERRLKAEGILRSDRSLLPPLRSAKTGQHKLRLQPNPNRIRMRKSA